MIFSRAYVEHFRQFWLGILCVFSLLCCRVAETFNYCSLCSNHIACNNKWNFGTACPANRSVVQMDTLKIRNILELHNTKRDQIALGRIKNYTTAAKMPVMHWNLELAHLAELLARTCIFQHDQCHKTETYPMSGQNIASIRSSRMYKGPNISIQQMIESWFAEHKNANMNYIRAYPIREPSKQIGHFTVMVNDKNNAVGCAMIRYREKGVSTDYLVCNYGYTNVMGQRVYESGRTASKCRIRDLIFKGLCVSV